MQAIQQLWGWARAHERHFSALAMAGGFAFDSYAFGRIDRPATQAVFIFYLIMAGVSIAVLHVMESRSPRAPGDVRAARIHTLLVTATQFALGALLSGFCVFYIRSASPGSSWPFLLFMAAIFIGQEYFREYASRLVFAALLFFFSLYSYAILLVPVMLHRIGTGPFLVSGGVAVAAFFFYMRLLAWAGHERYRSARLHIRIGMLVVAALVNGFYFLKVFPPLPLVLSDAGIYHDVRRAGADFAAASEAEPPAWRALFGTFPVLHVVAGQKIFLYSAIFAPYRLATAIEHRWEWRDPATGAWTPQQAVRFSIQGGRENGYRAYSFRTAPKPGQWRVNIVSLDGRAVGRVRFSVEPAATPPVLTSKQLK